MRSLRPAEHGGARLLWNYYASRRGCRVTGRTFANVICRRKPSSSVQFISTRDVTSGRRLWSAFVPVEMYIASLPGSRFMAHYLQLAQSFKPTAETSVRSRALL